jgi:ferredoxin-thioredoxin reductase catalytic subunit
MSDMTQMMKSFLGDWQRYGKQAGKHDAWIRKHARNRGWSVNPRWMLYTNLKLWIADSEAMYGRRYCPCYEPSGDPELDRKLICPCQFAQEEIDITGWCHCTLFGRGDLTRADYKRAEAQLMSEYRGGALKLSDGVLDTRGQHLDVLRGLPVPDAIHQVKRAVGAVGLPLEVIVATRAEAEHLGQLARIRGMTATVVEHEHELRVTLARGTADKVVE